MSSEASNNIGTRTRVLICEDTPDVAAILAERLKSAEMASDIARIVGVARTLLGENT